MATAKLTVIEAADRLGISERQVTNLLADGMPHAGTGNKRRILWPEARKWRDEQLIAQGKKSSERGTFDEALLREKVAAAELKELDLAERRGELMTTAEAERLLADAFARVRSKLLNLPNAVGMRISAESLPARVAQAQGLVDEVMGELAGADDVPEPA